LSKSAAGVSIVCVCLLVCGGAAISLAQTSSDDILVGVTSSDGSLVSFDPASGAILQYHVQIDPDESFTGLAYDRNHRKLYALTQGDHLLYTLNADTLQLANVTPLRIDPSVPGLTDVTSLAYDPATDTLYAAIGHWDSYPEGPIWDELARVDPWTGALTVLGRIDGPWIAGLAFSETERVLYALGVYGAGSWDSPDTTHVIRINPSTAAFGTVYVTPYHAMLGMALKEPGSIFSWINWTSHFFGETDVPALRLTQLGSDEASGAIGAMLVRTFPLPAEPDPPPSSPVGFLFRGHVTEVSDPLGRLAGRLHEGESFRGQLTYDAGAPFVHGIGRRTSPYGITFQSTRLAYSAPTYAAWIMNDRLDPTDPGPTDEFRLRGYGSSDVVISWTLIDPSGNAVDVGDTLPENFDLSRWQTNTFSLARYDPCCRDPIYRFVGTVDEIKRRPGLVKRPLPRSARRDGN
jgi:hypothetical protein